MNLFPYSLLLFSVLGPLYPDLGFLCSPESSYFVFPPCPYRSVSQASRSRDPDRCPVIRGPLGVGKIDDSVSTDVSLVFVVS